MGPPPYLWFSYTRLSCWLTMHFTNIPVVICDFIFSNISLNWRPMLWWYDHPSEPNEPVTLRIPWKIIHHFGTPPSQDSIQFRRTLGGSAGPGGVRRTLIGSAGPPSNIQKLKQDMMEIIHQWDHWEACFTWPTIIVGVWSIKIWHALYSQYSVHNVFIYILTHI